MTRPTSDLWTDADPDQLTRLRQDAWRWFDCDLYDLGVTALLRLPSGRVEGEVPGDDGRRQVRRVVEDEAGLGEALRPLRAITGFGITDDGPALTEESRLSLGSVDVGNQESLNSGRGQWRNALTEAGLDELERFANGEEEE